MTDINRAHAKLSGALHDRGYEALTPVQEAVLAPELTNRDLLVSAQTGSGKTVAFGLAFAPNLLGDEEYLPKADAPLALIVAPTRELAMQVQREFDWLYEQTKAVIASCVGGMDARTERRALARGAHIIVGTPGRLRDHIERGALDLSNIRVAVLDEADEMLDLGFREDLEFILENTPEERRTLMFSATVPQSISSLAKRYQNDAQRIKTVAEQKQHIDITYKAMLVANRDVENGIINTIRFYDAQNTIVFCATRAAVARMTSRFSNRGFSVVALSGDLNQEQRTHALQAMRDGRARVCIATDVAARGIDIPNLELVVHAELPNNKETLLHRSGRTGRAGRKGVCAIMVPANKKGRADRLLRAANIQADWENPPSAEQILERDDTRILNDPLLAQDIDDNETTFIARLLEQHSPEHIAAAFIRTHRQSISAPEDLTPVSISKPSGRERPQNKSLERSFDGKTGDFEDGQWISLSIGRNQKAEPRWLLPMLCKSSGLTKRNIGTIKIRNDETYVEIAGDSIDQFMISIGPNQALEKNIRVALIDGLPDFDREQTRRVRKRKPKDDSKDARRQNTLPKEQRRENRRNRDKAIEELTDRSAAKKSYRKKTETASEPREPRGRPRTKSKSGDTGPRDGSSPRKRPARAKKR